MGDAIYVGRGSKWGNPFHVGQRGYPGLRMDEVRQIDQSIPGMKLIAFDPPIPIIQFPAPLTIEDVIRHYRAHILELCGLHAIRSLLGGHDLACFCPLDQPCHADVLLELANG